MSPPIPNCAGPQQAIKRPRIAAPPGSWDTIFHVFGPQSRYPFAANRLYTPPDSVYTDYREVMRTLGIERAIVVQPNLHGFDNSVTLDVVTASAGRLVAVVKADKDFSEATAMRLHAAGARGVRFAFMRSHGGTFDLKHTERVLSCVAGLGWFAQFHMSPEDLVELQPWLSRLSLPVVIDHFGRVRAAAGLEQPGFRALLALQRNAGVWVRISGADRVSDAGPPYDDVVPFAAEILRADSHVLWGSDWPHSGYFNPQDVPNDGVLFDFLLRVADSDARLRRVLVENPEQLLCGGSR